MTTETAPIPRHWYIACPAECGAEIIVTEWTADDTTCRVCGAAVTVRWITFAGYDRRPWVELAPRAKDGDE